MPSKEGLVSIIVPCFNVVGKAERLLASLDAAPAFVAEIVFVNDGSQDATADQLAAYCAEQDARYRMITIANAGPGGARNAGFDATSAAYVWFVDADDEVDLRAVEAALPTIREHAPDVVDFDVWKKRRRTNSIAFSRGLYDLEHQEDLRERFVAQPGHMWTKVLKRAFLSEHALRFTERYFLEDVPHPFSVAVLANTLLKVEKAAYYYHEDLPSIMRGRLTLRALDLQHMAAAVLAFARERGLEGCLKARALRWFDFLFFEEFVRHWVPARPLTAFRLVGPLLAWRRELLGSDVMPAFAPIPVVTWRNLLLKSVAFGLWCTFGPVSYLYRKPGDYFARVHDQAWRTPWQR